MLHVVSFSLLGIAAIWVMITVSCYEYAFFSTAKVQTISYYLIEVFEFISGLVLLFIFNDLVSKQIESQGEEFEESEVGDNGSSVYFSTGDVNVLQIRPVT